MFNNKHDDQEQHKNNVQNQKKVMIASNQTKHANNPNEHKF